MKVAIYARVSTDKKLERQNPETQLIPLREYVARHEWEVYKEYVDDISAVKHRPKLQAMIHAAKQRKIDCIVAWKLDRFARSVKDLVLYIDDLVRAHGIRLIFIDQNIDVDPKSPMSMLTVHMIGAFAEFERALISERVKAGMERVKREGKHIGRSKIVLDMVVVNKLRAEGHSIRQIANLLKVEKTTVIRRLKQNDASTTNKIAS